MWSNNLLRLTEIWWRWDQKADSNVERETLARRWICVAEQQALDWSPPLGFDGEREAGSSLLAEENEQLVHERELGGEFDRDVRVLVWS